jgi:hypothetical protein
VKVFNILLIAFSVLLLTAAGLGLLGLSLLPGLQDGLREAYRLFDDAMQMEANLRWGLGAAGSGLLFVAFLAVYSNLSTRRWERSVVFHNPLGEVMVSLTALEDIGRQAKAEVPGVKDLKLRVLPRRRGLQATARVVLFSDANVPSTTELIQEVIRRRLQEVVGEGQDLRPRVIVTKVVFREAGEDGDLPVYRPYGRARRPPRP